MQLVKIEAATAFVSGQQKVQDCKTWKESRGSTYSPGSFSHTGQSPCRRAEEVHTIASITMAQTKQSNRRGIQSPHDRKKNGTDKIYEEKWLKFPKCVAKHPPRYLRSSAKPNHNKYKDNHTSLSKLLKTKEKKN